ncbi:MAG: SOS response-associated peptidase [Blastocatellia bacterium]|nr:SOS response-associated peptidase [Blastocatellia bacterium]
MCGRFTLRHRTAAIAERFAVTLLDLDPVEPRYNIAPTQRVLGISGEPERVATMYRWGLIPFWAKDASIGSKLINARSETVAEKPSFRQALAKRRCLIPADGFYEWQKGPGGKTPMYIRYRDGRLFAFAGLWETWRPEEGTPVSTCTVLTTEPNALMGPIHNRMPVILDPKDEAAWLDPETSPSVRLELLRPCAPDEMEAFPVSRRVNSPAVDESALIEPVRIATLFDT